MKRVKLITHPIQARDLKSFDDFYSEISHNWQHKAEQLQARRWHYIKRAMKGGDYADN